MCARVEAIVTMAPRARLRSAAAAFASRNVAVRLVASTSFQVASDVSASGAVFPNAGVGDDGIDAAETGPRHRHEPLDVRLVADIAGDRHAADLRRRGLDRASASISAQRHLPALPRQMAGNGPRQCRAPRR